jgi:hypothetical protein
MKTHCKQGQPTAEQLSRAFTVTTEGSFPLAARLQLLQEMGLSAAEAKKCWGDGLAYLDSCGGADVGNEWEQVAVGLRKAGW